MIVALPGPRARRSPSGTVVGQVVTAVSEIVSAVLPSTVALPPTVTALPLPAVIPWPTSVAVPPHLGELLGEIGVKVPPSPLSGRASRRARARRPRLPQPAYGVGSASAWGRSRAPVAAAAAGRRLLGGAARALAATGAATPYAAAAPGGTPSPARAPTRLQALQRRCRGAPRLLPFRSSVRRVARALAERPSTSPAALVAARASWLAGRLRLDALRRLARRELRRRFPRRPL